MGSSISKAIISLLAGLAMTAVEVSTISASAAGSSGGFGGVGARPSGGFGGFHGDSPSGGSGVFHSGGVGGFHGAPVGLQHGRNFGASRGPRVGFQPSSSFSAWHGGVAGTQGPGVSWRGAAIDGRRQGDLLWTCIDFEANVVRIERAQMRYGALSEFTKTEAGRRDIPMSPMLREMLLAWRVRCPRKDGELHRVFPAPGARRAWPLPREGGGRPLTYGNFRKRYWARR